VDVLILYLKGDKKVNGKDDQKEYKIILTNRKNVLIQGVENVESFDDEEILMETKMGSLVVKGKELHIVQLNLEEGTLIIDGYCKSLEFSDQKNPKGIKDKGKGLLQRILK
jgi:sporulation protein YabP